MDDPELTFTPALFNSRGRDWSYEVYDTKLARGRFFSSSRIPIHM